MIQVEKQESRTAISRPVNELRDLLIEFLGSECAWCESKENLQVDHIIPYCLGGRNHRTNVQALCKKCHQVKSVEDLRKSKMLNQRKLDRLSDMLFKKPRNLDKLSTLLNNSHPVSTR